MEHVILVCEVDSEDIVIPDIRKVYEDEELAIKDIEKEFGIYLQDKTPNEVYNFIDDDHEHAKSFIFKEVPIVKRGNIIEPQNIFMGFTQPPLRNMGLHMRP